MNNPKGYNGHKKRSKARVFVNWMILIAVVGIILSIFFENKSVEPKTEAPATEQNDTLTAEERANLKRQYELAEKEIILKKQKAALDADYKAKSEDIEAQLEAVRAEKTSFK